MKQEQKKHTKGYPEEYIAGKVMFFGREFRVTPDVLIPRLETEWLLRRAREVQKVEKFDRIVDIGCGSGIIGTSVADLVDEVVFLDISERALSIAEENFRRYYREKQAKFLVSDLLSVYNSPFVNREIWATPPIRGDGDSQGGSVSEKSKQTHPYPPFSGRGWYKLLFLANLPYIKRWDWENMSLDTRYEPELALFGGEKTGFELYERLFQQLAVISNQLSVGVNVSNQIISKPAIFLIIEFGFDQREIAEKVIGKYGWKYEFFPDFAGIERFCEIRVNE